MPAPPTTSPSRSTPSSCCRWCGCGCTAEDAMSGARAMERVHRATTDKVNILLVDDQPARLLSYETILAELGQNLVSVRSGVDALARLMKDDFALVLLDVSMPGMDGFE